MKPEVSQSGRPVLLTEGIAGKRLENGKDSKQG